MNALRLPASVLHLAAIVVLPLMLLFLSGCATTPFVYKPKGTLYPIGKGLTIEVGKVQSNLGFDDPKKIRFNVDLDRPVVDAVREALTLELREAGFDVGPGGLVVSVAIDSKSPGNEGLFYGALWTFRVFRASDDSLLYAKQYDGLGIFDKTGRQVVGSIWDAEGTIGLIRQGIVQFIEDTQMLVALKGPAPEVKVAQAPQPPPAGTRRADVDELPATVAKRRANAHAIVIGIEQYRQKLPPAEYAVHDAEVIAEYVTKTLGYSEENVAVLLNDRAAKSDLEKYVETWLPNRVEPNDTVFVYFSGHGAPNAKTGKAYLVPYDGDPAFVEKTGYPLDRLYDVLAALPAKEVVVMLDSCFSGAGGRSVIAKGMRPMVLSVENPVLAKGKVMVLAASGGSQVSSTYDQKGHGLLTYFFLKGLKGEADQNRDSRIELRELYEYLRPQVERTARREFNNEQTPQLLGSPEMLTRGVVLIGPDRR
jgi:hypothetical protein